MSADALAQAWAGGASLPGALREAGAPDQAAALNRTGGGGAGGPGGADGAGGTREPRAWMAGGLAFSVLLHAAVAGGIWLAWQWRPTPRPPDKLLVELLGVVANRQTEQTKMGENAPPPPKPLPKPPPPRPKPPAPPPKPAQAPAPPRRAEAVKAVARQAQVESPVKVAEKTLPPDAPPPPPPVAPAPPPPPEAPGSAQQQQISQTIRHDEVNIDQQRRYLVALKKAIKAKLFYPPEGGGVTGTVVISFALQEDGSLEPGSLVVKRSSGYSVLDEQALAAVRNSAPFGPPPSLPMVIGLDMPFEVDRRGDGGR